MLNRSRENKKKNGPLWGSQFFLRVRRLRARCQFQVIRYRAGEVDLNGTDQRVRSLPAVVGRRCGENSGARFAAWRYAISTEARWGVTV
jgi:hypothetical protein